MLNIRQNKRNTKNALREQDSAGISGEAFPEIVRVLQTQRIELLIDLAGVESRKRVLEELNENEVQKRKAEVQLQQEKHRALIDSLETELRNLTRGSSGDSEKIQRIEAMLDSAKWELAASQKAGKTQSSFAANELFQVALDFAETKARLAKVEELLDTSLQSRKGIDRIRVAEDKLEILRQQKANYEALALQKSAQLASLEVQLEMLLQEDNY